LGMRDDAIGRQRSDKLVEGNTVRLPHQLGRMVMIQFALRL
jgi:hypothetical protein